MILMMLLSACGTLDLARAGNGNPAISTTEAKQPAQTAVQQTPASLAPLSSAASPQAAEMESAVVVAEAATAATEAAGPSSTQLIPLVPGSTESPPVGTAEPIPQAASSAQQKLATSLNVPLDQVLIIGVNQVHWPDSCLGLPQPGEMCSQIATSGWRVMLDVNGQQYEARTDQTGSNVRWQSAAGGGSFPGGSPAVTIPAAGTPAAVSGNTFDYAGVSFTYSSSIASSVTVEMSPAVSAGTNEPPWVAAPEHLQLGLQGYPVQSSLLSPQISIYPVNQYSAANPTAAEMISTLQQFVKNPILSATDQVPFLPIFNAAQLFHAGLQPLDFQNGAGVRFVTQYSPSQSQINNQEIFYTYQGVTGDGQFYLSALLPVSLSILPDASGTPPAGVNYEQYLQQTQQQIQSQPATSFTPNLDTLDAMMRSLKATGIQ
jgi:hypothetical protein